MLEYAIIITALFAISLLLLAALLYRGDYLNKLLFKLGLKTQTAKINWAVFSWNNTMEKLDYKADVVFFGDSITRGSDFRSSFPDKRIVNLGYSGDTLSGMINRISMAKAMNPEQLFILGGINGLTNKNVFKCAELYAKLLDKMQEELPDTRIYVQSILPISPAREKKICKNESIRLFNEQLRDLARERGLEFIDLYPIYEKDGVMNPELTVDGIHLKPQAYEGWANALKNYIFT